MRVFQLIVLQLLLLFYSQNSFANIYLVVNTLDAGAGSFRECITLANANPGPDTIHFNIPGGQPHTFQPNPQLPAIDDTLFVDGTTQNTFVGAPLSKHLLEIDGILFSGGVGIQLSLGANNSHIRHLVINRYTTGDGIRLDNVDDCQIYGCYIGTDTTGLVGRGNQDGIMIQNSSKRNQIGAVGPFQRNLISDNTNHGIRITGGGTDSNMVYNNYIGVGADGTTILGNSFHGLIIESAAEYNFIGDIGGNGNIISNNGFHGINLQGGGTDYNWIRNNKIGTDISGTLNRGNGQNGIRITQGKYTTVGGPDARYRNYICANGQNGVIISGAGCDHNLVRGNFIGVDATGGTDLGNTLSGVQIAGTAEFNIIGGGNAGLRNIISGNDVNGVDITANQTDSNYVRGNYIGTDSLGTTAIPNTQQGIRIDGGAQQNMIGGSYLGYRNLISGNTENGVFLANASTNMNVLYGNFIGVDVTGLVALPNMLSGIQLDNDADQNQIGGGSAGQRNIISGNNIHGIHFTNLSTNTNIHGNYIGLDSTGLNRLPNQQNGIAYFGNSGNNNVGGTGAGEGNIISGNGLSGIFCNNSDNGMIEGNWIGLDATGNDTIGNAFDGIHFENSSSGWYVGSNSLLPSRNFISGNVRHGIYYVDNGTNFGKVVSNVIGLDISMSPAGNQGAGIYYDNNTFDNFAGGPGDSVNVISRNGGDGISVVGANNLRNFLSRNSTYENVGLGIDLGDDGPDTNDGSDVDNGPNAKQNYPVIDSVKSNAGFITIYGNLHSINGQAFTVEFYSNDTINGSGYGEGKTYLGDTSGTCNGAGDLPFIMTFPAVPGEPYISGLSYQNAQPNTSEFSLIEAVQANTDADNDYFVMYQDETVRSINVLRNDTFSISTWDLNSLQIITGAVNGISVAQNDSTISYTINGGYSGHDSIQYSICEAGGSPFCDTAWVRIYAQAGGGPVLGAGNSHSIVSCGDGTAYGTGANTQGQLGVGDFVANYVPATAVRNLTNTGSITNIKEVALGSGDFSLAITTDDSLIAWGSDATEALGTTGVLNRNFPIRVEQVGGAGNGYLGSILDVAATNNSAACVLMSNGRVLAWGENNDGECGRGTTSGALATADSALIKDVVQIAGAGDHYLALKRDGTVWAWGRNNQGQCGQNNVTSPQNSPVQVQYPADPSGFLQGIRKVECGEQSSFAITWDNRLLAWGDNSTGRLGDGTAVSPRTLPVFTDQIGGGAPLENVQDVSCGNDHCIAVLTDQTVVAWGGNGFGELGDGTVGGSTTTPQEVWRDVGNTIPLDGVTKIKAGEEWNVVVANDSVLSWGINSLGQLMHGTSGASVSLPTYASAINFCGVSNSPPVAQKDTLIIVENTLSAPINVAANDSDPDANLDLSSVSITLAPSFGTVDSISNTGIVYYTPNTDYTGYDTMIYQICDVGPLCVTDTICVTVNLSEAPGGVFNNLQLWLRADELAFNNSGTILASDGQPVQEWHDRTINGFNATNTGAARPTFRGDSLNFNPVLSFDGIDDGLQIPMAVDDGLIFRTGDYDFFIVAWNPSGTGGQIFNQQSCGNEQMKFELNGLGNTVRHEIGNSGTETSVNVAITPDRWNLMNFGRMSSNVSTEVDGATNSSVNGDDLDRVDTERWIGRRLNCGGTAEMTGNIAEIIAFDRRLGPVERSKLQSYLAIKYGMTLNQGTATNYQSSDATIIYAATTTHDAYDNDIAGIGQDDSTGLNQPKSGSINEGAMIQMSQPAHLADGEFLVWGNDGTAGDLFQSTDVPAGFTQRLQKIWRVDKTNDVGVVTVKVNISDLPTTSVNVNDYALLINSTTTFNAAPILNPVGISGDTLTFAGIGFNDNDYFTLAMNIAAPGGVVNGLDLWLKADGGAYTDAGVTQATNTQAVQQWNDNSGNDFHATQLVGVEQPTWNLIDMNYNPSLSFDETNLQTFQLTAYKDSIVRENNTFFGVGEGNSGTQEFMFFAADNLQDGNSNAASIYEWQIEINGSSGNARIQEGTNADDLLLITPDLRWTQPHLVTNFKLEGSTSYLSLDGNASVSGLAPNNGEVPDQVVIGGHTDPGTNNNRFFNGEMGEIVSYGRQLNATEELQVQSYLALKYGLTLANTAGPVNYVNSSNTTIWNGSATYQSGIAGIGRDDASALNQKQSISADSAAVLTIGLGNLAASNADNSNTFGTDESFLIWGHDSIRVDSVQTSDVPAGYTNRMSRLWTVNETGTVGNTQVRIYVGNIATRPSVAGDYGLVLGPTTTMNGHPTITASSLSNDSVIFNVVDFSNNDYFTLVYDIGSPPVAVRDSFNINENDLSPCINVVTNDTDPDGNLDPGSVSVLVGPNFGTVDSIGSNGCIYYTPDTNFAGIDTLIYQVCDSTAYCDSDTAIIYVNLLHGPGGIINGLQVWFKADYGTTTTVNQVDTWQNRANGNFTVLTRGTTDPQLISNAVNFNPSIEFDGNDHLYGFEWGSNYIDPSDNTSFLTLEYNSGTVIWKTENSPNDRYGIEGNAGTFYRFDFPDDLSQNIPVTTINDGKFRVIATTTDAVSDSIIYNGLFEQSQAGGALNTNQMFEYDFGDGSVPGFGSVTSIPEQIFYNRKLSSFEKQKVQSYLALKYGITLDQSTATNYLNSTGGVVFDASGTHLNYSNDIAGIGRDDVSTLIQPTSMSINDSSVVKMSNPSALSDGDFLIWGNNGLPVDSATTNEVPVGYSHRLAKVWRVDRTGNLGNNGIDFYLGNYPGHPTNVAEYGVVIHNSTTFSAAAPITLGLSYVSDTLKLNSALFNDDDYFTLVMVLNVPPVATDDTLNINEDTLSAGAFVVGNDSDPDNNIDTSSISVIGGSGPFFGTIDSISGGYIWYTPNTNYFGPDSLDYRICDLQGQCDTARLRINVFPVADTVVALDDTLNINEDTLSAGAFVVGNDSDIENNIDTTSISIVPLTGPFFGTIDSISGGYIWYSPNPNYFGPDSVKYRICDATALCDTAMVRINVISVPDDPLALDDTLNINEDTLSAGAFVVGNDSDIENDLDTSSISVVGGTGPFFGTVDSISGGFIWYTPNANYSGPDSLDYRICDLTGRCDTARLRINVLPVQDTVIAMDDTLNINEDTLSAGITVVTNDTDADGNIDISSVSIIGGSGPFNGTIDSVSSNGTIWYTPDSNYFGPDSVRYIVCDLTSLCDTAMVRINVAPLDDNPIAFNDTIFVSQGGNGSGAVFLNDIDVDGDLDNNSAVNMTGLTTQGATAGNSGTGLITVDYAILPAFTGWDSVQYQICDLQPVCVTAWLYINVGAGNPPDAVQDSLTINEDTTFAGINIAANDTDPDGNLDTSTVTVIGGPLNGTINSLSGLMLVYTPDPNWFGIDTIVYTIRDSTLLQDSDTLFIWVNPIDDDPVITSDSLTIPEDTTIVFYNVTANDTDADSNLQINTLTILSGPFNGVSGVPAGGNIDYTPNLNFNGQDSIYYRLCDSTGRCDSTWFVITVTPVPDTLNAVFDTIFVTQGGNGSSAVWINDTDVDGDLDSTTVIHLSGTTNIGAAIVTNNGTGTISVDYSGVPGFTGWDSVQYRICDATALCDTSWLFINVFNGSPPIANKDTLYTAEDTIPLTFNVTLNDTDPDGNLDTSTVTIIGGNTKGILGTVNGFGIQYQPMPDSNGTDFIVYQICDSTALCDTDTLCIFIAPRDDAPVAVRDSNGVGQSLSVNHIVTNNDFDVDGNLDTSSVTIVTNPLSGAIGTVTGAGNINVDYSGVGLFTGLDSLQYRVCDSTLLCDSAWLVINVLPVTPFTLRPDTITIQEGCADVFYNVLANDSLAGATIDSSSIIVTTIDVPLLPVDTIIIDTNTGVLQMTYSTNQVNPGTDFITYRVCNTIGLCDSTTVMVVRQPSLPPVPTNVTYSTGQLSFNSFNLAADIVADDLDWSTLILSGITTDNFNAPVNDLGNGIITVDYDSSGIDTVGTDQLIYTVEDTACNQYVGAIWIDIDPDPDKIIIYTGASPNGDGINDFWEIRLFRFYMNSNVRIYNRWGNLVYTEDNVMRDKIWDGSSNTGFSVGGSKVPDGTYFYTVELPDEDWARSGYIEIRGGRQK